MKIMRWEAEKKWLCEWYKDYTIIIYQFIIDEKAGVIETEMKMPQWC